MTSIAQSAQITVHTVSSEPTDETVNAWISDVIVARLRRDNRPSDWRGRPYMIWRAEERAYWNMDAWARMIGEYPMHSGPKHFGRAWGAFWKTPERAPSIIAEQWRFRDVGPHDTHGGRRHSPAKRTVPHGACHITFPDWAPMLDATPSTRASVPVIHRDEHVNAPSSPIKRSPCKCGATHHG